MRPGLVGLWSEIEREIRGSESDESLNEDEGAPDERSTDDVMMAGLQKWKRPEVAESTRNVKRRMRVVRAKNIAFFEVYELE